MEEEGNVHNDIRRKQLGALKPVALTIGDDEVADDRTVGRGLHHFYETGTKSKDADNEKAPE